MESTGGENISCGHGPYGVNRPVVDAGVGDCQTAGNKKGSLAPLGYDLLLVLLHQAIWLNHPGYTLVAKKNSVNVMKSYLC